MNESEKETNTKVKKTCTSGLCVLVALIPVIILVVFLYYFLKN